MESCIKDKCKIFIIGGASGVGKTSLLESFLDIRQINTGDLFKLFMLLGNRDEIRKGDWSLFEANVITEMIDIVSDVISSNQDLIIDTHFAAKIHDKQYRIGLKEECFYQLGKSIFKFSVEADRRVIINVILISISPYLLLTRRRLDKSRNRELIPSDCYNSLRYNDAYSHRYLSALWRAEKDIKTDKKLCSIKYHIVKNEIFELAQKQLTDIIRR